jgi:hypothetical protein
MLPPLIYPTTPQAQMLLFMLKFMLDSQIIAMMYAFGEFAFKN